MNIRMAAAATACFGLISLAGLSGCATTSPGGSAAGPRSHAAGFDVLIARDSQGHRLVVVPSTGIMLRDGSRESQDVEIEWTQSAEASRGRMLVYSADKSRLLATVEAGDITVQHRGGGEGPSANDALAVMATPQ